MKANKMLRMLKRIQPLRQPELITNQCCARHVTNVRPTHEISQRDFLCRLLNRHMLPVSNQESYQT